MKFTLFKSRNSESGGNKVSNRLLKALGTITLTIRNGKVGRRITKKPKRTAQGHRSHPPGVMAESKIKWISDRIPVIYSLTYFQARNNYRVSQVCPLALD